ncbi:conserved hypothetical protein [Pediculus humanus corporis]|uniref:ZP domain-containing protein n=1 Tax=Pediculus humanus subsp. corporis TaxID=121224 RepID=E0VHE6_PEDHC|nr:uncharacterized protein Phum_PHUM207310 [Pediculus humanus corporis]EEB12802.1 conserved hypothetical protein [Pediculus humanus corporis]
MKTNGVENEPLTELIYDGYNGSSSESLLPTNYNYPEYGSQSSESSEDGKHVRFYTKTTQKQDKTGRNLSNETEILLPESTEQKSVVLVSDSSGYVPVNHYHHPRVPSDYHIDYWDRESRKHKHNFTRVQHIEAECQDDYMKIRVGFNGSFTGLLYSSGYSYDPDCIYINGTGRDYYEFYIQLNRCGTLGKNAKAEESRKSSSIAKNFMWNTITVQYNPLIEEEWDEHFKVTCEYGYDFWKTVTFPFLDVEVATGNPVVFTLSPPECYMEIRYGYGTSGTRVTGPVRVGDPLTLIIYMRSKFDGFDIVVNDCFAHNGATKKIQLIDQYGCPVDEKLISRFRGSWSESGIFETQVFAYMKTFRFTGSPALYIECDVRMCHGRCPSQPCHWRNTKSLKKRDTGIEDGNNNETNFGLSNNINLFQSLRVLQEGESPSDNNLQQNSTLGNLICLKHGAFSTIIGSSINNKQHNA